jgi:hypothetical protein
MHRASTTDRAAAARVSCGAAALVELLQNLSRYRRVHLMSSSSRVLVLQLPETLALMVFSIGSMQPHKMKPELSGAWQRSQTASS